MLEKVAASDIELEKVVVVRRQWQECSLGFITYIVFVLTSRQERVYRNCFHYMFDGLFYINRLAHGRGCRNPVCVENIQVVLV